MGLGNRRVAVIQSEKKYDELSEDFGDEEDAGVVSGVIVGEMWPMASPRSHTALAIEVASQKFPRSQMQRTPRAPRVRSAMPTSYS